MSTDLEQAKKPQLTTTHNGSLSFNSLESLHRLSNYLHASRMLPKQYDTPEKIGTGIQYAMQLGFKDTWLLALRQIAVINGTPSMFGDLPLALVRSSGELEVFDEYLVDKEGNKICLENKNISHEIYAAVCHLKRKGGFVATEVFTVDDAKKANVWGKNVWLVYPKRMIQMRARSVALKNMFADVLNGMAIGEYDFNTTIENVIETKGTHVPENQADKLNALAEVVIEKPEVIEQDIFTEGQFDFENEPSTIGGLK